MDENCIVPAVHMLVTIHMCMREEEKSLEI